MAAKLRGLQQVIRNIEREGKAAEQRAMAGLIAAGLIVEAEAKRRVPRERSILFNSGYSRRAQDGSLSVHVGFNAFYAIYVHENLEAKLKGQPRPSGLGVYWGPQGEPRFLANALEAKKKEVLDTVVKYARGGGVAKR